MELKSFKEYSLNEMKLRLLMVELKASYGNPASHHWRTIRNSLPAHVDGAVLDSICEYLKDSADNSLSSYGDLFHRFSDLAKSRHDLLDVVYRIFDECLPCNTLTKAQTAEYWQLQHQLRGTFMALRGTYFDEISALLETHRGINAIGELVSKYGSRRDATLALMVAVVAIADEVWQISVNLAPSLLDQLRKGQLIAKGIEGAAKNFKASEITQKEWEFLEFISLDSAAFNQRSYSNLVFSVVKPDKAPPSNKVLVLRWLKEDYKKGKFPDFNTVNLDELANEYQERLQKVPANKPYSDIATPRRIIADFFEEQDSANYKKPSAGRPKISNKIAG